MNPRRVAAVTPREPPELDGIDMSPAALRKRARSEQYRASAAKAGRSGRRCPSLTAMTMPTGGTPCQCGPCLARAGDRRAKARERYLRWLRWRRVVQRRLRWIDPGKPPITVLRWLAIVGIGLAWWANGSATSSLKEWVPYVVIAGVLVLPDIAGFAVGGLRLDLKQAKDEIAALRVRVDLRQIQTGDIHIYGEKGARLLGRTIPAAIGELAAMDAEVFPGDNEAEEDVPS